MKPVNLIPVLFFAAVIPAWSDFKIAKSGKAECVILQSPDATAPETNAVAELASTLQQITGAVFAIQTGGATAPGHAIVVGPGPMAAKLFPEIDLSRLGPEELVMRVKEGNLLLAGGRPRGTIYAVNRFLQEQCGVRWWTPWATNIPHRATLRMGNLDVRDKPAFEYRGPYWSCAFDPEWKMHNGVNSESGGLPATLGGSVTYKGFAHTFYPLVPPEKYFGAHPEWYSLVNGRRTHENAQLCLSNPELRDFMVQQVKAALRESPDADIISVTQNDCDGHCECKDCKALDDAEGSHAGSMIAFVNYIAEKIEPEFPNVAVDTFAYQYTRHPPKTIKPRHNVIVRLCSIECNFREPLDHPSNAAFLADLQGWSKICSRLYIWDYVTDFRHYIVPHPNWFVLGPNLRLFEKYNVKGVFEEGAYAGPGAEMAEMRAWMLAQLMWNPHQDDSALMNEFLNGYYGAAGKFIRQYLDLLHDKSKNFYLATYTRKESPPYMQFPELAQAEKLWQEAEAAVARDPELLARVRMAHLPMRFAWLKDWRNLRSECWEQNANWPLPASRKMVADEFGAVCAGVQGKDWTQVRVMSERGELVENYLKQFAVDPPENHAAAPVKRLQNPPPPKEFSRLDTRTCVDLQDNLAELYKPGEFAEIRQDVGASDYRAVWMPGNHKEWAFRIAGENLPAKALNRKWQAYAVVRIQPSDVTDMEAAAFTAGVYDIKEKTYPAGVTIKVNQLSTLGYHAYPLGTVELNENRDFYVAPPGNASVKAVYVDRIYLVPAK